MPSITISRGGGWADRFRSYAIVIDDEHRGTIRSNRSLSFEVSHGSHHVQIVAGVLYGSPRLRVHVDARGVTLACGSNKTFSLASLARGLSEPLIWLKQLPL